VHKSLLTRDEALLTLNDRLGHQVEVNVQAEAPPTSDHLAAVMSASGLLRHWREAHPRSAVTWASVPRNDIEGLYHIGAASFDVTDLDGASLLADDDEPPFGLEFELADSVTLSISWGAGC
jgi:hypothetical protein